jgi:hypothetical protein
MGARLLTTTGDQGASTRDVYSPIEFSLGLDKAAIESYIPAIRKIHAPVGVPERRWIYRGGCKHAA